MKEESIFNIEKRGFTSATHKITHSFTEAACNRCTEREVI